MIKKKRRKKKTGVLDFFFFFLETNLAHEFFIALKLRGGPLREMKGNYLSTLPVGALISLTLKPEFVPPVGRFALRHYVAAQWSGSN